MRTCKACGESFEFVSRGRGRPPSYCGSCKTKPREVKTQPTSIERVVVPGGIGVGDRVVFPLKRFFSGLEDAIKYATVVTVKSIDGEEVTVLHPKEKTPLKTNLHNLTKIKEVHHYG